MRDPNSVWELDARLADVTPHADWDVVASMIASLRVHLFEQQTVPVWNFMFCGGRPELAVPFSWAFTWPSLFAYALPPVPAILAVWTALSLIGLLSAKSLFETWSGSRAAGWLGAVLYVAGGCYSARFNAGHVTFAFHHLVPLLMLLFERGFARRIGGERATAAVVLTALVSFGLFTSALPHGLIHFHPAWLLLVAVRIATAGAGVARALRAAAPLLVAHALGLWLSAYKLWPIVRWQLASPRRAVPDESYGLGEVLANHLSFVPGFDGLRQQAWHVLPSWGYNAYVGPVALALALLGAAALAARWRGGRSPALAPIDPVAGGFALLLAAIGVDLALGNAHPASAASWFRHLPVLEAVRGFNRYQILSVFAVASLASIGFGVLQRAWDGGSRRAIAPTLAVATLAPVLAEAALHVAGLPGLANAELLRAHKAERRPGVPELIGVLPRGGRRWKRFGGVGAQTALVRQGYWVASWTTDLDLVPPIRLAPGARSPLSSPPPVGVVEHTRHRLTLQLAEQARGRVTLHLASRKGFGFDAPVARSPGGVSLRLADLPDRRLRVRARYDGPAEGAWTSAAALAAAAGLLPWWIARGRRRAAAAR